MASPTFTWPDWQKAPRGTRFRHNVTGRTGTLIGPAKTKNNGAIVVWDERPFSVRSVDGEEGHVYFVGIARDATPMRFTAWDLIGFDGTMEVVDRNLGGDPTYADVGYTPRPAMVRVIGGRALYENVGNEGGEKVRLARLDSTPEGLHPVTRYVEPDTELELVVSLDTSSPE